MKLSLKRLGSRKSSRRVEIVGQVDSVTLLAKELTATFKVFDKDGDGKISKSELGIVLRALGDDISDDELNEVMVKVDGDGDGFIDLQEFIHFHIGRIAASRDELARTTSKSIGNRTSIEEKDSLQAAFDVFDADKNGFISAAELQRVMWSLGDKNTSLAECRHMINCVDKDGDHMVDFNEFQCLMSGTIAC